MSQVLPSSASVVNTPEDVIKQYVSKIGEESKLHPDGTTNNATKTESDQSHGNEQDNVEISTNEISEPELPTSHDGEPHSDHSSDPEDVETALEEEKLLREGSTNSSKDGSSHDDSSGEEDYEKVDTVNITEDGVYEPPDGGWGWMVCAASFWTNGTLFGILNIFGILYVELLEEFEDEGDDIYFKLSWIGSLEVATTFFMSTFSGILVDQFGIQLISGIGAVIATAGMIISSFVYQIEVLYITYGIIIGLGSSLVYTPSMVILGHYFKKHLGLVNGIVSFGSAVFTFVLSVFMPWLLDNIGLRNTMRVLAGILGVLMVCPFIWRPLIPRKPKGLEAIQSTESIYQRCGGCAKKVKQVVNVDMFKNKGYVIWIIGVPIAFMGYFIPFVHIVEHTRQMFPGYNAEILVTCIGGVSGISRLISGKLADLPNFNRVWIMQFSFVLLGIATCLLPFAKQYGVLLALACVMGIGDGCFICMLGPIAYDLLGAAGMGQGIGVLLGLMSIPMTAGPPLAGYLRGVLGTYKVAFLIAGMPPIIGACVLFLMPQASQKPTVPTLTETIMAISMDKLADVDPQDKDAWPLTEKEIDVPVVVESCTDSNDMFKSDKRGSSQHIISEA